MKKEMFASCFLFCFLFVHSEIAFAVERVVLTSVPTDRGDMRIYLMADKKSWMDYENFMIQVGEHGQEVLYRFPDWYHGKYDPALYYVDISGDKRKDIVVELNNDRAGWGNPIRDIHILNQLHDLQFKKMPMVPMTTALNRLAKVEQKGKVVTVLAGKKRHRIDVSKQHFVNPRKPYFNVETMEYAIKDGTLTGIAAVSVVRDDAVYGGLLGHVKIKYGWDGSKYDATSITFKLAVFEE